MATTETEINISRSTPLTSKGGVSGIQPSKFVRSIFVLTVTVAIFRARNLIMAENYFTVNVFSLVFVVLLSGCHFLLYNFLASLARAAIARTLLDS